MFVSGAKLFIQKIEIFALESKEDEVMGGFGCGCEEVAFGVSRVAAGPGPEEADDFSVAYDAALKAARSAAGDQADWIGLDPDGDLVAVVNEA
ncbi:MAG TPA: hypothetical protein VMU70_02695, partial [Candidatus Tyrphobacter sp.]|nr:hypothetical protein [Candidatus Tyrphobacter sp.]